MVAETMGALNLRSWACAPLDARDDGGRLRRDIFVGEELPEHQWWQRLAAAWKTYMAAVKQGDPERLVNAIAEVCQLARQAGGCVPFELKPRPG